MFHSQVTVLNDYIVRIIIQVGISIVTMLLWRGREYFWYRYHFTCYICVYYVSNKHFYLVAAFSSALLAFSTTSFRSVRQLYKLSRLVKILYLWSNSKHGILHCILLPRFCTHVVEH